MQDLKELNEVIAAIKEEIRQGAEVFMSSRKPSWTTSRDVLVC